MDEAGPVAVTLTGVGSVSVHLKESAAVRLLHTEHPTEYGGLNPIQKSLHMLVLKSG